MRTSTSQLLPIGLTVLWILCSSVCYSQDQEAHFQLSSKGSSNNLDSLINKFNSQTKGKLKAETLPASQKAADLKKYTTLSPSTINQSVIPAKDKAKYAKYASQYNAAKKAASQLAAADPLHKFHNFHLDSGTVYNNKYLKKYYDSVKKVMPVMPTSPVTQLTSKQLVKEVNKKFLEENKKTTDSLSKVVADAKREEKTDAGKIDLAKAKLHDANAQELAPMAGSVVKTKLLGKSKYKDKLDSLRKADMKIKGLVMKEENTAEKQKLTVIKQKEKFQDKSYFEGVVGLPQGGSITVLQLSPALAYHASSHLSFGAGPNLLIKRNLQKTTTTGGLRAFAKASFFNRHLYMQGEDQMTPHTLSTEGSFFTQHNLYGGGGYVLPFLSPLTFNISLMYRFYANGNAANAPSPWIFRIGISTNKKTNK